MYHEKDFEKNQTELNRKINKVSQNRQIEHMERGYEIISHNNLDNDYI